MREVYLSVIVLKFCRNFKLTFWNSHGLNFHYYVCVCVLVTPLVWSRTSFCVCVFVILKLSQLLWWFFLFLFSILLIPMLNLELNLRNSVTSICSCIVYSSAENLGLRFIYLFYFILFAFICFFSIWSFLIQVTSMVIIDLIVAKFPVVMFMSVYCNLPSIDYMEVWEGRQISN